MYITVHYCTVKYITVLYCTVLYFTVHYCILQDERIILLETRIPQQVPQPRHHCHCHCHCNFFWHCHCHRHRHRHRHQHRCHQDQPPPFHQVLPPLPLPVHQDRQAEAQPHQGARPGSQVGEADVQLWRTHCTGWNFNFGFTCYRQSFIKYILWLAFNS